MPPDFREPAFAFVALCTVRFGAHTDGSPRRVRSDYRCQLRYADSAAGAAEARVYFVGQESALSSEDVPVVLAFLDWEGQRERCRVGLSFELCEGEAVVAVGVVNSVAVR